MKLPKVNIVNYQPGEAPRTSQARAARMVAIKQAVIVSKHGPYILAIRLTLSEREIARKNENLLVARAYDRAANAGILRQYQARSIFAGQIERLALPA